MCYTLYDPSNTININTVLADNWSRNSPNSLVGKSRDLGLAIYLNSSPSRCRVHVISISPMPLLPEESLRGIKMLRTCLIKIL